MNRFLETHAYIAEWIPAVPVVLSSFMFLARATKKGKRIAGSHLPTVRAFPAKCGAYITAALVLVFFRLPGNRAAAKEMAKYAVLALALWMLCEAIKQRTPQQHWADC
jgi:hypothetical protein